MAHQTWEQICKTGESFEDWVIEYCRSSAESFFYDPVFVAEIGVQQTGPTFLFGETSVIRRIITMGIGITEAYNRFWFCEFRHNHPLFLRNSYIYK